MAERYRGRVKVYYQDKKFGFISMQNKETGDVFLHWSQLRMDGFKTLEGNETVEFSIEETARGFSATDVVVIERNQAKYNTEDKFAWCLEGEKLEEAFVREIAPKVNKRLIIHPNKATNPTSIDLLNTDTGEEADLKTQKTPFFSSGFVGYKLDPQYTVTFNKKDYERYKEYYPAAIIYFYVNWNQLEYKELSVKPLEGVWEVPFKSLQKEIEMGNVHLHEYLHRKDDDVNAKNSYLFDLNTFKRLL